MDAASIRPRPLLIVLAPFVLLALLFAGTDLLAMRRVSQLRAHAEDIEQDMLADVELLSRMRSQLDAVRLLSDQHVIEKGSTEMATLDAKIAQARADYASAAAEFESSPMLPDEEGPWRDLKSVLEDIRPRLDAALARSRVNDDAVAFRQLEGLQGDFERATGYLRSIIEFNRRTAHTTVANIAALQRSATVSLQVLAVGGVALLMLLGVTTTRILQRSNEQLRDYVGRLEASNRELDAFAGRVAHDLRGPLTTATLATSRLSRETPSPGQLKTFEALQRAFGRMGAIIQDLLAISRVQADVSTGPCDPASAAGQLREEFAPRLEGGDVSLVIEVQSASVRCSEGLLRQVMWNLTDNALKYRRAEAGPRVEVCGLVAGDRYVLSVRDNGVGISADETQKVFEPFYRADRGKSAPGSGLGLSIVKRAVEASGGTVSVDSEVGHGSTFVARLPLA